jgi:hypothetical protein
VSSLSFAEAIQNKKEPDHRFKMEHNICVYDDGETIILRETVNTLKSERSCNATEKLSIEKAKNVVKKYWVSSHEVIFGLLSKQYKQTLREQFSVANAADYSKQMGVTERVWIKQTYERSIIKSESMIQVIVLSSWTEEGYDGVATYIFDMVREDGQWKIAHVMF